MTNVAPNDPDLRRRLEDFAAETPEESANESQATIWDDLGLTYVFRAVQKRARLLFLIPILWIVLCNVGFLLWGRKYSAELQVVPATLNSELGHGANLGALSAVGLGSMLGQLSNDDVFSVYLESWTAPWFAEDLAANDLLLRRMFPEQWSNKVQDWREPASLVSFAKRLVYGVFGGRRPDWRPPGPEQVLTYLQKNIAVQRNSRNVLTRIVLRGSDRVLATDILTYGHTVINKKTAQLLFERSAKRAQYLTQKLSGPITSDVRETLIKELAMQERTQMLAFADTEFAAQSYGIFAKPSPITPRGATVLIFSLLASTAAILAYVLLLERGVLPAPRVPSRIAKGLRPLSERAGRALRRGRAP